ncbi:hypothetical protein N6G02_18815 [Cupriavidus gilardii]|uniref:Apea-like HEPN domain-containing protein n=1 Tax=Cupriavidus gilardii TaxID=82541 RepID=A0ABY4VJ43_9BURK|nr:hypothetical protein [Cupriavidus gilardii]MCT9118199.1 hypothetical protein [Cupriavidus gilardii]USE77251.1 hypothetical protein NDR89_08345 [Cupriavidus gilardii]
MSNHSLTPSPETYIGVGGDFARVFDTQDYLIMFNSLDEVSVVLRAHMILEEFLNIWCSRVTSTEDLFAGTFVPFKTKLIVARNLGLASEYEDILDRFNEIRNRYSHRRKYALEESRLNSIKDKVNALHSEPPMPPCEEYHIYAQGHDQFGRPQEIRHEWSSADMKKKVLLVVVQLVMKLVQWMQVEFNRRGIQYSLVSWPVSAPGSGSLPD